MYKILIPILIFVVLISLAYADDPTSPISDNECNDDPTLHTLWHLNDNVLDACGANNLTANGSTGYATGLFSTNAGDDLTVNSGSFFALQNFDSTFVLGDGQGDRTIALWAFPDIDPGDNELIGNFNSSNSRWGINYDTTNKFSWSSRCGPEVGEEVTIADSTGLELSNWTHVAITFNDTDDVVTIYRNGTSIGSDTLICPELGNYSEMRFGDKSSGINKGFDGRFEEMAVWNKTLDPDQIYSLWLGNYSGAGEQINITEIYLTSTTPDQKLYAPNTTGNTTDVTPTFNLTTDQISDCYYGIDNSSWDICATTTDIGHICTQGVELSVGLNTEYFKCNVSAGNISYGGAIVEIVSTPEFVLKLDGLNESRKYEYGTTVNITTSFPSCFDVLDETGRYINFICGTQANYTINKTVEIILDKNLTSTDNETNITIDNRTDLVQLEFNFTGLPVSEDYPNNTVFDINSDGILEAIIPGLMVGVDYMLDRFIYNNIYYADYNLTFDQPGSKIIYLNKTQAGQIANGTLNFTISITDLDAGNNFNGHLNFSEILGGPENSSTDLDSEVPFDDFTDNGTFSKWIWDEDIAGDATTDSRNSVIAVGDSCQSINGFNGGHECLRLTAYNTGGIYNVYPKVDFRYVNSWDLQTYFFLDKTGSLVKYGFYGEDNGEVVFVLDYREIYSVEIDYRNWTFYKKDDNTIAWNSTGTSSEVAAESSVNIAGLTGPIRMFFWNKKVEGGTSLTEIHRLNISGLGLNYAYNTTNAIQAGNWTKELFDAPNNIERAKLTFLTANESFDDMTADTQIAFWLSNDNMTTWEFPIINDSFHEFDSVGDVLAVGAYVNSSNDRVTPIITDLRVQIISSSGSNLTIDVGDDGILDAQLFWPLDSTSSPINYSDQNLSGNASGITNYDCNSTNLTCLVPIKFTVNQSIGLEISNMNYTNNPNPINITSLPETASNVSILAGINKGIVQLTGVMLEFFGSKDIVVKIYNESNLEDTLNHTIQVRYSQFNLTFPSKQLYWQIFPTKRNQSGIEPFGQNSTDGIWHVDSTAYEDPFSLYVKYNESIDSCVENMTFQGDNLTEGPFNISLNTSYQEITKEMNSTNTSNIFTWTDIACGSNTDPFYIPFFCFKARCNDCVDTFDWEQTCDWYE